MTLESFQNDSDHCFAKNVIEKNKQQDWSERMSLRFTASRVYANFVLKCYKKLEKLQ